MALFDAPTQSSNKTPSSAPLLEAAGYPARVVRIIDLGKQPGSTRYPQPQYKMLVTFELLDEYMKEVDGEGNMVMVQDPDGEPGEMMTVDILDKPRWFDFEFTYNTDGFMGDNSHIFKFMKAIDALKVEPNLEQGIAGHEAKSLKECLGAPLVLGLIQDKAKSGKNAGKLRNKAATFSPMKSKEKREARPLINPTVYFDLGNPDLEVFNKLPGGDSEWAVKNRITSGLDFKGSKLDQLLGGAPAPTENKASEEEVDAAMRAEMEAQAAAKAEKLAESGNNGTNMPF